MKRMTYTTLMKKVADGKIEVTAWCSHYVGHDCIAEARIYPARIDGRPTRCHIEVTKIPADVRIGY